MKNIQLVIKRIAFCMFGVVFMISAIGCEALVKKFTRKSKKDAEKPPIVLIPEDYKDSMTPEERYRQYYNFWKSWQDELAVSLLEDRCQKKKLDCADQAIKNMEEMKKSLSEEKQKALDKYIQQMYRLRHDIDSDPYGNNVEQQRTKAESIKRNVVNQFTYSDVKACVK